MKGFVLINTIFIISLIALIILTLQNRLQLDLKIVNQLTISHRAFYELESTALRIIDDFKINRISKKCQIDYNSEQLKLTYVNLLKQGCNDVNRDIYYTVIDLGEFICLRSYQAQTSLATHHYLLNIVSRNIYSKVLQIRYVTLGSMRVCNSATPRYVKQGLLSWVYY